MFLLLKSETENVQAPPPNAFVGLTYTGVTLILQEADTTWAFSKADMNE